MKKKEERPEAPKEKLFVWSQGGIRQVQKKVKEIFRTRLEETGAPPEAESEKFSEQRNYPRLDLKLPILYKVIGEGATRIPSNVRPFLLARSTNISPIGLCLELAEPMPPNTVMGLSIHLVNQKEKFTALGRVVWCKPSGKPDHFLVGLQFVVVDKDTVKEEEHSRMQTLLRHMEGV